MRCRNVKSTVKLTHSRDLNALICPVCHHMLEVPRRVLRDPLLFVMYQQLAETAHFEHRKRSRRQRRHVVAASQLQIAQRVLGA